MNDILGRPGLQALARLAWSNVLVALDYDGTLAPIVDEPDRADMRERTRTLLAAVARAYPCVVISGRSQLDANRRVGGTGVALVVGNHGLEPWRPSAAFSASVRAWLPALQGALGARAGVLIEDKVFSVAVHFRHAPSRRAARSAILQVAAGLDDVRVVGGKCVVNLVPRGAPHKGTALELARNGMGCDAALYVGDDATDEDVFALQASGRLLGVRVGRSASSRASFFLRNQQSIDVLLERLLTLRPRGLGN